MSIKTVTHQLVAADASPLPNVYTEIVLLAPGAVDGAYDSQQRQVLSRVVLRTDSEGSWETQLIANAEITPAGTVYQVTHKVIGFPDQVAAFIVPTGGGTVILEDLLVDPPEDIPPQASLVAFDPQDSGMSSVNVEDAIIEAFENGGGGGGTPVHDVGHITFELQNFSQDLVYSSVEVAPWISSQPDGLVSHAPTFASAMLPLNLVNAGDAIRVVLTSNLTTHADWDSAIVSGTAVIWNQSGTELIEISFGSSDVTSSFGAVTLAPTQVQRIGTDLSVDSPDVLSADGGTYNVVLTVSAVWD